MKNRPFDRPSLINFNNELEVYEESGCENDNAEETKREKNPKKMKEVTYIKIDNDDERHKKEQTKNMSEGNHIEVERKICTISKKSHTSKLTMTMTKDTKKNKLRL